MKKLPLYYKKKAQKLAYLTNNQYLCSRKKWTQSKKLTCLINKFKAKK